MDRKVEKVKEAEKILAMLLMTHYDETMETLAEKHPTFRWFQVPQTGLEMPLLLSQEFGALAALTYLRVAEGDRLQVNLALQRLLEARDAALRAMLSQPPPKKLLAQKGRCAHGTK